MANYCDPLTLTYIAGGFTVVGALIGAFAAYHLGRRRDRTNTRNIIIQRHIDTISGEINRIKTEKYTSPHSIGDISAIETIIPQIESLGFDVSKEWEKYKENEHRRKSRDGNQRKEKAIESLNHMIVLLEKVKT